MTYSNQQVQSVSEPEHLHRSPWMCVCVSCLKWPVMNGLPRQTHNTQSHSFSYMGGEATLGIAGHPLSPVRFPVRWSVTSTRLIWILQTIQMSSNDLPPCLSPHFAPFLAPSWASFRCWLLAPIAELRWGLLTWLVVSQGWQVPSVFGGIYQLYLCLCTILKRFWVQIWSASCCSWAICGNWWCLLRCRATSDPCDLFVAGGMQWAQASSTGHEFKSLILPGLSYSLEGIDLVDLGCTIWIL